VRIYSSNGRRPQATGLRPLVCVVKNGEDDPLAAGLREIKDEYDGTFELCELDWRDALTVAERFMERQDGRRAYYIGFGYPAGQLAGRLAVSDIENAGGVCLVGAMYYGSDSTDSELERLRRGGCTLPLISINGLESWILPFNETPLRAMPPRIERVTRTDGSLAAGYEEQRFWRKLNGCREISFSDIANIGITGVTEAERRLGLPLDRSYTREIDKTQYLIGDIYDCRSRPAMRYAGAYDCADELPAGAARLALEFFTEQESVYTSESFWDVPLAALGGISPRESISRVGGRSFCFDTLIRGEFAERVRECLEPLVLFNGDDMSYELLEYWRSRGMEKELHERPEQGRSWVSYLPVDAKKDGKRRPVLFIINKGIPLINLESFGIIQFAAKNDIIVIAARDANSNENFLAVLDEALTLLPADEQRVYLTGHSFCAACAGRLAVKYPERIAGVCLMGCRYYGEDSTLAEERRAAECHMPLLVLHGTEEVRELYPYSTDALIAMPPRNTYRVSTATMSRLSAYEELRFWCGINGCAPPTLDEMAGAYLSTDNICTQKLGIPTPHTDLRMYAGTAHYFADFTDNEKRPLLRYVGVEGLSHFVSPTSGEVMWDFFRNYARDTRTGELIRL